MTRSAAKQDTAMRTAQELQTLQELASKLDFMEKRGLDFLTDADGKIYKVSPDWRRRIDEAMNLLQKTKQQGVKRKVKRSKSEKLFALLMNRLLGKVHQLDRQFQDDERRRYLRLAFTARKIALNGEVIHPQSVEDLSAQLGVSQSNTSVVYEFDDNAVLEVLEAQVDPRNDSVDPNDSVRVYVDGALGLRIKAAEFLCAV